MENCTHQNNKRDGRTKAGTQRYRCLDCGRKFTDSTSKLQGMRIGTDKAAQIVRCMCEGVGIRGTARLAGVAKDTVLDVLGIIGQRCRLFLDDTIFNVPVKDVQADELWSFVFCKDKTRKALSLPTQFYGDKYCYVGMERHHKLVLAWHIGSRDMEDGRDFLLKLNRACWQNKFQLTTDGWAAYKRLTPRCLPRADLGILIKVYGKSSDTIRYSPAPIIEIKHKVGWGQPDLTRSCTSHVERGNLTVRMGLKRFTRLTNGFSRKLFNHEAALGLHFAHYNFVARHSTLKTTPAVAAGIASDRWSVEQLIETTAAYNAPHEPTAGDRFIDRLPDE